MRQVAVIMLALSGLAIGCGSDTGDGGTTPMAGQPATPATNPGAMGMTPGTTPTGMQPADP